MTLARKYGISSGLLCTWRQQVLCGALAAVAATQPRFVRVDVVPESSGPAAATSAAPKVQAVRRMVAAPAQPTDETAGRIEIVLRRGATVRVDALEGLPVAEHIQKIGGKVSASATNLRSL